MNDSIRRDDMKQIAPTYSAATSRTLRRAARQGAANITAEQADEIARDWVMADGRQIAIDRASLRAFRL
jgi:hypothetical protein